MSLPVFSNNPELANVKDISAEEFRQYSFPTGSVTITAPVQLCVTKSGSHRVLDAQGNSHYIPSGFLHIAWKSKEGKEAFLF